MLEQVEALERVGAALLDGTVDPSSRREARAVSRGLSDLLAALGANRAAAQAREIGPLLEDGPPDPGDTYRYADLVVRLRDTIEQRRARHRPAERASGGVDGAGDELVEPLGVLAERRSVMDRVAIQIALAARHRDVVAVAVVAEDEPDGDDTGQAAKRSFLEALGDAARPEDVVGRCGQGEVLVSRYGEQAPSTRQWIARTLPGRSGRGPAMGVAEYPDAETPQALLAAARAELSARDGARNSTVQAETDVVVVEDEAAVGRLLIHALEDRGYRTHLIRHGTEAMALLTGETPALRARLILLDVGLPGVDGFTLLRQLRRDRVTRTTRVVVVSGRSTEEDVVRALDLGAFDYVPKPFQMSELLHRVRRAMSPGAG